MGGLIHLEVLPARIDPMRWAELFDDTLKMLRQHPSQLVALSETKGRACYTTELEKDKGAARSWRWEVIGDMASLRTGEPFSMGRALHEGLDEGGREIAAWLGDPDRPTASVFRARTFGRPYQQAVLAAAALIEASLPDAAIVHGDFDTAQARLACTWASALLGRRVRTPLVVRPGDLYRRLARHHTGTELLDLFATLSCAPRALNEHIARESTTPALWKHWKRTLPAPPSRPAPAPPPETTLPTFQTLIAVHSLDDLSETGRLYLKIVGWRITRIYEHSDLGLFEGPTERLRTRIDRAATATDLPLTEDAWADIDAATNDDLRFVLALFLVDADQYGIGEVRRALLENTDLRRELHRAALEPGLGREIERWVSILS